jgi:hypothetical protein
LCFFPLLQVTVVLTVSREGNKKAGQIRPFPGIVSGGACTNPPQPRWRVEETAFPAISGVLGAFFVNFKLFNVIFI